MADAPDVIDACASGAQVEAVFLMADISGYTSFMLKNRSNAVHATLIVQRLLEAVMKQLQRPFEVEEVEGDALFCAATREAADDGGLAPAVWPALGDAVVSMFDAFFEAFEAERVSIMRTNPCGCVSCAAIENLRLKIIVHAGSASRYTVGRHVKLAGVDVIMVHRLLKNSVKGDAYVLFTTAAFDALGLEGRVDVEPGKEQVEGLGVIPIRVQRRASADERRTIRRASILHRLVHGFQLVFGEIRHLTGRLRLLTVNDT